MAEVTRKGFKDKNGNNVSLIAKVINAITGHFAGLNNKGEVVDSGYGPSDFAEADHEHKYIFDKTQAGENAKVVVYAEGDGDPQILLSLRESSNSQPKTAIVDLGNMDNLKRALKTPSSAPEDDATKLITSKAVYDALAGKMDAREFDSFPMYNSTNLLTSGAIFAAYGAVVDGSFTIYKDGITTSSSLLEGFVNGQKEGKLVLCGVVISDTSQGVDTSCVGIARWLWNQAHTQKTITLYIGEYMFVETYSNGSWVGHWTKTSISSVLSDLSSI